MGIRTPDLLIANETLYQLSYDPNKLPHNHLRLVLKTNKTVLLPRFCV